MRKVALALVVVTAAVTAASAVAGSNSLDQRALTQARKIKADITARYARGPKLTVTEASPTGVIESYLLLTADFLGLRVVPADNGIHYAICPVRATCPYPGPRAARPASAFIPRRQALELALRTFLETSATVVSVSLPTPEYVFFLVERDELRGSRHGCAGEGVGRQSCAFARRLAATDGRRDHTPQALRAARSRADP